jgi:hypothetical protein
MVAGGGGADSMLQFRLEWGGDGTKRCRNMKWSQRAHLDSMRKNCDMMRWRGDID